MDLAVQRQAEIFLQGLAFGMGIGILASVFFTLALSVATGLAGSEAIKDIRARLANLEKK